MQMPHPIQSGTEHLVYNSFGQCICNEFSCNDFQNEELLKMANQNLFHKPSG
jgi:hypothetical protein